MPFEMDKEVEQKLLSLILTDHYFNDETSGLGSTAVEFHLEEIEQRLRVLGYEGPKLAHGSHYYSNHGQVYWAYNPQEMSSAAARKRTDEWVKNYKQ